MISERYDKKEVLGCLSWRLLRKKGLLALNGGEFQKLCDRYLSKKMNVNLISYGSEAGTNSTIQGTPDSYFIKDGKYFFCEYTIQKRGIFRKIKSDIEKCIELIDNDFNSEFISEIIYCHVNSHISPSEDFELREICQLHNINLKLIGIDEISSDLLYKYRTLANEFLDFPIGSCQIFEFSEYIDYYESNKFEAPIKTDFLYRDSKLEEIFHELKSNKFVVLCGKHGCGKTRIALEYGRRWSNENDGRFICIKGNCQPLFEELKIELEFPGKLLVLIDDISRISDLKSLIELMFLHSKKVDVQAILTDSNFIFKECLAELKYYVAYSEIMVNELEGQQIEGLIEKTFGIKNQIVLEFIQDIAKGNPRIALLSGMLYSNGVSEEIKDIASLYDEYFKYLFSKAEIFKNKEQKLAYSLVALFRVLDLDRLEYIMKSLSVNNIETSTIKESISQLSNYRMLNNVYDRYVTPTDELLSIYLTKNILYDIRLIDLESVYKYVLNEQSPESERILRSLNSIIMIFGEDEEIININREKVTALWDQLEQEDSEKLEKFIHLFHHFDELRTIVYLNKQMERKAADIDYSWMVETLSSYGTSKYCDDAIQIILGLFESYQIDVAEIRDALISGYGINKRNYIYRLEPTKALIDQLNRKIGPNATGRLKRLAYEVCCELSKFEFFDCEVKCDGSIQTYSLSLNSEEFFLELRDSVISLLKNIIKHCDKADYIYGFIKKYISNMNADHRELLIHDSTLIMQIFNEALDHLNANDCHLVDSYVDALKSRGIDVKSDLSKFLENEDLNNFKLIRCESHQEIFDFQSLEEKKRSLLANTVEENRIPAILRIIKSLANISTIEPWEEFQVTKGLMILLEIISKYRWKFLYVSIQLLKMRISQKLNLRDTIEKLYDYYGKVILQSVVEDKYIYNKNKIKYLYYCASPAEDILEIDRQNLLDFLISERLNVIEDTNLRDVYLLKKYSIIEVSSILYERATKDSNYFNLYFYTLFYDPDRFDELLTLYSDDIELLADIYFLTFIHNSLCDPNGTFLLKLLKTFPRFLAKYTQAIIDSKNNTYSKTKNKIIYDHPDFIDIYMDVIGCITVYKQYKYDLLIDYFDSILIGLDSEKQSKSRLLINRIIETYYADDLIMIDLFMIISTRKDITENVDFILKLLGLNKSLELFKKIPILPIYNVSFGKVNSTADLEVSFLGTILDQLEGTDFLEHRLYLRNMIEECRKGDRIKAALTALNS